MYILFYLYMKLIILNYIFIKMFGGWILMLLLGYSCLWRRSLDQPISWCSGCLCLIAFAGSTWNICIVLHHFILHFVEFICRPGSCTGHNFHVIWTAILFISEALFKMPIILMVLLWFLQSLPISKCFLIRTVFIFFCKGLIYDQSMLVAFEWVFISFSWSWA